MLSSTKTTMENALVGRDLNKARATPPAHPPAAEVNERTNEQTNNNQTRRITILPGGGKTCTSKRRIFIEMSLHRAVHRVAYAGRKTEYKAQYTPPTRRNCRVESRRRCVLYWA